MSTELTLPEGFGKVPAAFAGAAFTNDELGAGVAASYAVMGIKGKVWSVKFGGEEQQLMREDGDGPRNSIEVVLVKASPAISKIYYKNGYVDGSNQPPDCWSGNGITPDPSVKEKMCPTCAQCPMNAWGSRTTDAGKQAKACSDSRRVAVVPLNDIPNELAGGPMLLRVPAASLKDLKAYGDLLASFNYPYFASATRIAFDVNEAFPKFVFSAIRPLTEDEAKQVIALREDRRVATVLAETIATAAAGAAETVAKEVPKSPFEQGGGAAPVTAEVTKTAEAPKKTTAKPKPAATAQTAQATPEAIAAAAAAAAAAKVQAAKDAAARLVAEAEAEAAALANPPPPKEKTPQELAAEKLAKARAELAALEAAAAPAPTTAASLLAQGDDEVEEEVVETAEEASPAAFDALLDGILADAT